MHEQRLAMRLLRGLPKARLILTIDNKAPTYELLSEYLAIRRRTSC